MHRDVKTVWEQLVDLFGLHSHYKVYVKEFIIKVQPTLSAL